MLEKQMRKKRTNALLSVSLLLSASWSGAALGRENIDFQVMVIPDRGKNTVTSYWPGTRAPTCLTRNHVGCYEIPAGEDAEIRVTLTNGDNVCAHSESWRLKSVVLGGEGDLNNPAAKPGPDGWGKLSPQAVKDFDADQVSGEVKAAMDGNTATFQNQNTAAYSIWYKVQVESCAADVRGKRRVIEFDPRIDNRGSG
jgi:hypothetical protein